jgi:3',5'-nucleoside bisphosphate phosphatase
MKKLTAIFPLLLLLAVLSPLTAADVRREIQFPDVPGYQTLKCDLHTHSVFSDGSVWPPVRVDEAWRQGLDAIALTDHIEYQPHKNDLPTNHGRSYDLAAARAKEKNLLFPKAAEITRDTPPGHFNALFLNDVRPLDTKDFVEAVKQANEQGAFVFWNHQGWKGEEAGRWLDVHTTLYNNKWLHGMEVCNGDEYYPSAHQWCLDKNLVMLGNTDIHDPDLITQNTPASHRTLTLVFVKERSLAGLKEALVAGRTAVWFKDQVIGRKEWIEPLFKASIRVSQPHLRAKDAVWLQIQNVSDVDLQLTRAGKTGPAKLTLPARSTSLVKIGTSQPAKPLELSYTATNFLIAPKTGLPVVLQIPGP